jgi:triosephosphate isomerase (TIM)
MMVRALRPLVAGNWKMNGLRSSAAELSRIVQGAKELGAVDLMICPPATLIALFAAAGAGSAVASGAFTGDLSAEMLRDVGATAVIVGHSERRIHHNETDADVRAKALAARRAGLCAIICVGETRAERENKRALAVVQTQLDASVPDGATAENLVVAYEPVWAIGSGLTPTPADVAEMHGLIRKRLQSRFGKEGQATRILYGGSVKPSNAKELMGVAEVDGALVGGASLKADEFLAIAGVYSEM